MGTWDLDLASGRLVYNERFAEILGFSLEEIVQRNPVLGTWAVSVHPDDREGVRTCWIAHLKGLEGQFQSDHRVRHKLGHWVWVSDRGRIIERDEDGRALRASGTYLDITERKQAEEKIEESQPRMELALQSAEMGTWSWTAELGKFVMNERSANIFGYSWSELEPIFNTWKDTAIHPDDEPRKRAAFNAYVEGETSSYRIEYRMKHKAGHWVWVLTQCRIFERNLDGKPILVYGSHLDITERKRAEEELRESQRQMELALRGANLATWDLDLSTYHGVFNPRFGEMLGYAEEEVTDRFGFLGDWQKHVHPDDKKSLDDIWNRHVNEEDDFFQREHRMKHKSGRWVWLLNKGRVLERDDQGRPLRACGTYLDITMRKEAEEARRITAERLDMALAAANDGFYDWDLRDNSIYFDDRYFAIAGFEPGAFPGTIEGWEMCIHPDDLGALHSQGTEFVERRIPRYDEEFRFKRADGSWMWIRARAKIVAEDENGKATRIIGTHTDITNRKEMEEELRKTAERLDLAMSVANDGLWDWDLVTDDVYFDERYYTMAGYEPFEFPGNFAEWTRRVHPDDLPQIEAVVGAFVVAEIPTYDVDYRFLRKDLSWMWIRARAMRINSKEDGSPIRLVGTHADITERKVAEEALHASQIELQLLYENSLFGMALCEKDGTIVQANRAYLDIVGYSLEEACSLTYWDVTPREYSDQEDVQLQSLEDTGRYGPFEKEYIHKEGHRVPVLLNGMLVAGVDGVDRIWSIVEDITQNKKSEEDRATLELQLRQSQKMEAVGQLAGGIAHDFNNILQAIMGYGEIAHDMLDDDDSIKRYLNEILRASERAKNLVRQLLAFSRRQVLDMRNVDLNHVVLDLVKMIGRLIGPHITLNTDLAKELGTVRADAGQLEQILVNLCVNSRDAMTEGGTILIETKNFIIDQDFVVTNPWATPGEYVRLTVSDTGWGMDENTLTQIFEPFFTTKGMDKGTGLGLSTVYGLVKQHMGLIHVESEVDSGTTFQIYLPTVQQSADSTKRLDENVAQKGTETIMFAEDEEMVSKTTTAMLEASGYQIINACDGKEAVDLFEKHGNEIDMVLLDVMMPNLGGRDAYEQMKKKASELRVLFASGYNVGDIHTDYFLDEGLAFIQEPYQRKELLNRVREVLDIRK